MADRSAWSLAASVMASIGAATAGALAYAGWVIFRKTKTSQPTDVCVDARARRRRKLLFWFVLVVNAGMLLVPFLLTRPR